MRPRDLEFEDLISVLEKEHTDVMNVMKELDGNLKIEESSGIQDRLRKLKEELLQHMLDEESGVLRILIKAYGKDGSRDAIEVFQEHVDIMDLLRELDLSVTADRQISVELLERLDRLMSEHFRKEGIMIFPWALKTHYSLRDGSAPEHVAHPPGST
jgi:iron-sulfur cluster repair protein YtfE (RIC family)